MITIKSEREVSLLRTAGNIVYKTHQYIKPFIKEGVTTKELDSIAEKFIRANNATPSFKGYDGFPTALCISVNDEVVHGFPSERILKNGDIVTLDIGACYKGYHGDSAWTYKVGTITEDKEYLMKHTMESLFIGLEQVKPGNKVGGHGIGTEMHEDPDVPNYGAKGTGPILKEGMVIAIEPMLTLGSPNIYLADNDWTIITEDHSPSAHYEHTVVVTQDGYEILTGEWKDGKRRNNWNRR